MPGDKGEITGPVPPVQPATAYNGRPVDVEQLPDGSLLVSDDSAGTVYRVSYRAPLACRTGGGGNFASTGATIPGTANGCIVNLGGYGQRSFKSCVQWDTTEKGHWVQMAYNLYRKDGKMVLDGAMVVPRHQCTNRGGWIAAGLPKAVGEDGMLG